MRRCRSRRRWVGCRSHSCWRHSRANRQRSQAMCLGRGRMGIAVVAVVAVVGGGVDPKHRTRKSDACLGPAGEWTSAR